MLSSHFDIKDFDDVLVIMDIQIFLDRPHGVLRLSHKGYVNKIKNGKVFKMDKEMVEMENTHMFLMLVV